MGSIAIVMPGNRRTPLPGGAVIWNTGVFMQLRTYAVADKFPYHRVTASFDIPLHRAADIADAVARHSRLDSRSNRLSRVASISACASSETLPHGKVHALSPLNPSIDCANVNGDDVALFEIFRVLKVCRG